MRLRLGLLCKDLSFRFISVPTVSRIFNAWIEFMDECLQELIKLPPLNLLQKKYTSVFSKICRYTGNFRFIQTPSSLKNKTLTYSHYRSHNTFKSLVGVNTTGAVVFLSDLYGGSVSDVEITRKSGLYELLGKGDAVMVDEGFVFLRKI
jgi:hypothetical protein